MTDNEIIKALKICSTYKGKCTDCPAFVKVDRSNCKKVLLGAVEIINRQKAEIEEQQSEIKVLKYSNINLQELYQTERKKVKTAKQKCIDIAKALKTAKAEAYKEFAERLESYLANNRDITAVGYQSVIDDIESLIKELVGDNNES